MSFVLRKHHLQHLAELEVGEELLLRRFARGCATSRCSARCCSSGVWLDLAQRGRILANASVVQQHMEPTQEQDPTRWFTEVGEPDADFPSGRGISTRVSEAGCVFLDSRRRCVLQLAEAKLPGLKPFFCRAYPVVIVDARLTLDDELCSGETQCCVPVPEGELTIFDVCTEELKHVLGEEGFDELRHLANTRAPMSR